MAHPLAFVHKTRDTTRPNVACCGTNASSAMSLASVLSMTRIDTAGTTTEAINVLTNAGAKKVIVVANYVSSPTRLASVLRVRSR